VRGVKVSIEAKSVRSKMVAAIAKVPHKARGCRRREDAGERSSDGTLPFTKDHLTRVGHIPVVKERKSISLL
jgi:hypothetical protein